MRFNELMEAGRRRISRAREAYRRLSYVCTLELPVVSRWATRSAFESDVCKMETGGTIKHGRVKRGIGRACASLAWFLLITPTKFSSSSALAVLSKRNEAPLWVERPATYPYLCAMFLSLMKLSRAHRNFTALFSILTRAALTHGFFYPRG